MQHVAQLMHFGHYSPETAGGNHRAQEGPPPYGGNGHNRIAQSESALLILRELDLGLLPAELRLIKV